MDWPSASGSDAALDLRPSCPQNANQNRHLFTGSTSETVMKDNCHKGVKPDQEPKMDPSRAVGWPSGSRITADAHPSLSHTSHARMNQNVASNHHARNVPTSQEVTKNNCDKRVYIPKQGPDFYSFTAMNWPSGSGNTVHVGTRASSLNMYLHMNQVMANVDCCAYPGSTDTIADARTATKQFPFSTSGGEEQKTFANEAPPADEATKSEVQLLLCIRNKRG